MSCMITRGFPFLKFCCGSALLLAASSIPLTAAGDEDISPVPLVEWVASASSGLRTGDKIDVQNQTLPAAGSEKQWAVLRFLPPGNPAWAADCAVYWSQETDARPFICLGSAIAPGIWPAAARSAVIQCGDKLSSPREASKLTLLMKFRLNDEMCRGGPSPGCEMDGTLLSLPPSFTLAIHGRGATGKNLRLPYLYVKKLNVSYVPITDTEIEIGKLTSLAVSWDASDKEHPVRFHLNGKELPVKGSAPAIPSEFKCEITGPPVVGGDRAWGNAPIDLERFAIYGQTLDATQIEKFMDKKDVLIQPQAAMTRPPEYSMLPDLNTAAAWISSGSGPVISEANGQILQLSFGDTAIGTSDLLLKQPIPVGDATSINFWQCLPNCNGPDRCIEASAIFSKSPESGKPAEEVIGETVAGGWASHIGPPNTRAAGLWKYARANVPIGKGVTHFRGFRCRFQVAANQNAPGILLLKDFGLERIDYRRSRLYYVLGNCRDNLGGARALTELSGGSEHPFILLDNVVDQAKAGRPPVLDLMISVFDEENRLVFAKRLSRLKAKDAADFFQKIEIPLLAPGTYRIKGKSYNSETGGYFTTDWVKLIIIRGNGDMKKIPVVKSQNLLDINPDRPFGRLEKSDPLEIEFHVQSADGNQLPANCELRYDVIPYSEWIPGTIPVRPVKLGQKLAVTGSGIIKIPYAPKHSVELVVAELWAGGKRIDREELPIGVRNELERREAPGFFSRLADALSLSKPDATAAKVKIPTLKDITADSNAWMNSQTHELRLDDAAKYYRDNCPELKKLSPFVGFRPDLGRLQPIPGVYDWDALQEIFDAAAAEGCRVIPYLAEKWPTDWMPVEFFLDADGTAHRSGTMWGYMVGRHNYASGRYAPEMIRKFNQQLARRFIDHPGFGAYYFENEHIDTLSLPTSTDPGNRARFSRFLQEKYRKIGELNRMYGTHYGSFEEVGIPTGNAALFPKKLMQADLETYEKSRIEEFVLQDQFDAVRSEDPIRPIIVYNVGTASAPFFKHIAENGGMMANGGVHSLIDGTWAREAYNAVPGLMERMEPHGMWHYEPMPNGYDEMIFGMLSMGGRGLAFHFFLPATKFNFSEFRSPSHLTYGGKTGYFRIDETMDAIRELRPAEKLHDPVGIMSLRHEKRYLKGHYGEWMRPIMGTLHVSHHYEPLIYHPGGDLAYLDTARLIFLTDEVIDRKEADYLKEFTARGGYLVMTPANGRYDVDNPDDSQRHFLLETLGIDALSDGAKIDGLKIPHDVYKAGKGNVLLLRDSKWGEVIPLVLRLAAVPGPIADSDDKYMQMHTLQNGNTYYLATTHRGFDPNAYDGPKEWNGKIRCNIPLPEGKYRVTDIWNKKEIGVMTPAELAKGFDAGKYTELEMKIFRLMPVK
ncbi:MAG: beta-galactosidase [Victivallales bacterium]